MANPKVDNINDIGLLNTKVLYGTKVVKPTPLVPTLRIKRLVSMLDYLRTISNKGKIVITPILCPFEYEMVVYLCDTSDLIIDSQRRVGTIPDSAPYHDLQLTIFVEKS